MNMKEKRLRYGVCCLSTPQSYMASDTLGDNKDARRYDFLVDMRDTEVVTNEMLTRSTLFRS